jgi:hypothetical protein
VFQSCVKVRAMRKSDILAEGRITDAQAGMRALFLFVASACRDKEPLRRSARAGSRTGHARAASLDGCDIRTCSVHFRIEREGLTSCANAAMAIEAEVCALPVRGDHRRAGCCDVFTRH